jgi:hypothetical protein
MAKKTKKKPDTFDEQDLPAAGDVFAFKLEDGRYGACRVLRRLPIGKSGMGEWTSQPTGWCVRIAVTPWIGKKPPTLKDPQLREVLTLTHHSWEGDQEIYLVDAPPGGDFERIGNLPPTNKERRGKDGTLAGEWAREIWGQQVLMQWEWDHVDRAQLLSRENQQKGRAAKKEDRAAARRLAKLKKMSLTDFRSSRFLTRWTRLASKEAVQEMRQSFHNAIDRMIALGPKAKRNQLLAEVKRLILQWNKLHKKHGGFMTTTERDDLCVHLADLFVVAGLNEDDPIEFFEKWEDL